MNLRKQFDREEIDYASLIDALSSYANPRDKIRAMLRSGDLIRVKKGLYVFGPKLAEGPYCKELLANLIYGPSCLSLEYALSFYGLIPERVEILTSVTNKRNKDFDTPIGSFTYRYIHPSKYPIQINQILLDEKHPILIASQEKALADTLTLTRGLELADFNELKNYFFNELRIDDTELNRLQIKKIKHIATIYQHSHTDLLLNYFEEIQ